MKTLCALLFIALLVGCTLLQPSGQGTPRINPDATANTYINGLWLTRTEAGLRFVPGVRHTDNGIFVSAPAEDSVTVDLQGQHVVPPYGEAHNHSVDGIGTEKVARRFMSEGIFYYKNPNSIYSYTKPALPIWQQAETLDVSFSYGGLSKDEGHPEKLYRMLSGWGLYGAVDAESLDGAAFFEVSTLELLEQKWPKVLAQNPDFVKLYLLDHDGENNDGLPGPVFQEAVQLARAANLRTTVHVETVQDLALAVKARADEAAHLPAYNLSIARQEAQSRIPDELIETMVVDEFVVVTTVNVSRGRDYTEAEMNLVTSRQADNLKRMYAAGVPLAIGSDSFQQTAWDEIQSLKKLNIFDDATLFELWVDTPRLSIFPNRAIGTLGIGYEASFLVLACNPLEDIACSQKIQLGIKQGIPVIGEDES